MRGIAARGRISAAALLLCVGLGVALSGCQTSRSFGGGCPGIYSGVRFYNDQISSMPWDGKIFFLLDLPFSAITDTLVLPYTAFANPKEPPAGWVIGCKWVER